MSATRLHGTGAERMLHAAAAAQRAQEQETDQLHARLRAAMDHPYVLTRIAASLTAVRDENGLKVISVALASGERIDIPVTESAAQNLGRALVATEAA